MKIFIFAIGSLILLFVAEQAWADDKHHNHQPPTNNYQIKGIALGIANSQIHPELGTKGLQFGLGIGTYEDATALSAGIHKRVGKVLIGGTIG